MDRKPRRFLAPNASPMTLGGTITYVVGQDIVAIIDPGSSDPAHLDVLAGVIGEASRAVVIVTHDHPDHSAGAIELVDMTGAALLGGHTGDAAPDGHPPAATADGHIREIVTRSRDDVNASPGDPAGDDSPPTMAERPIRRAARAVKTGEGRVARASGGGLLADGVSIETDHGELIIVRTPGHSPDHVSLHWPSESAIFCGDLMMGGLDTAVVAAPEGDLVAYLESLERLRGLAPRIIYPAHGPPFTDPNDAIDRYIRHRHERVAQVRAAIDAGATDAKSIADHIYGDSIDPSLRPFAESAVAAYAAYILATDRGHPV